MSVSKMEKIKSRLLIKETLDKINQEVILAGFIHSQRDHGKIKFIDLRDVSGILQLVILPDKKDIISQLKNLKNESVIYVKVIIRKRPEKTINPNLESGHIEGEVLDLKVLSPAKDLPFDISTDGYEINEELRLKYRYLDLRRARLQRNIKLRSEFIQKVREFLFGKNFIEIETPLLTKSTPEGARDFITPSRIYPGKFFALPQSPQQYKQLLMIAGFERYFQIARCLRDEDLRRDRGFEHTQIDLEMSYVEREDVMNLDEQMITKVTEEMGYKIKEKPFPIFTYQQAIAKFKADKFDLRTTEEKEKGILAFAWVIDFPFFEKDKEGHWTFTHNPFSQPKPEHIDWLLKGKNISRILTTQYDLVCNGYEVGGGSIRSNKPEILKAVFKIMGYKEKTIQEQFGHMLEAFSYGAPPHGGLAHGVERLLMILTGEEYLREVQAFPQTSSGRTSVMEAPSTLSKKQLAELNIKVVKTKNVH